MVTRHHTVDHAELERRRRVDHIAEIEELTRLLEADDPRHHEAGPGLRVSTFRLAEHRIVRRDRKVAEHRQLAAGSERVALYRGKHGLAHVPGHQLQREAGAESLVVFERSVAHYVPPLILCDSAVLPSAWVNFFVFY